MKTESLTESPQLKMEKDYDVTNVVKSPTPFLTDKKVRENTHDLSQPDGQESTHSSIQDGEQAQGFIESKWSKSNGGLIFKRGH